MRKITLTNMTENTIVNGGCTHRIFANVDVPRVAAGTEKAMEEAATEIATRIVAALRLLDVKENKKKTARKVSVQHVADIAAQQHQEDVLLAKDHKVARIVIKKKDADTEEQEKKPKKGKKADKEKEDEKKSEARVEMLYLAMSPVSELLKTLLAEGQPEDSVPFVFTDRSVTAAHILLEKRLLDFAADAALLLAVGPNKKKPRKTITEDDVRTALILKKNGL